MDFLKQNALTVGGATLILIGTLVYFVFFSGNSSTPALTASNDLSPVSTQLLVTLQNLRTIKLDDSIFSDPAFLSLTDFGVTIPFVEPGRRNPFAPLSGFSSNKSGAVLPPISH